MAGKPKEPDRVKSYMLRVRMTEADRVLLQQAADVKSLELSTWARHELVALARKVLARERKAE
jgi:uncharacterized protein (DUF1778 family)